MASFLRELKMAKTYLRILVLAFVCCLPAGIIPFVDVFKSSWSENEIEQFITPVTWTVTLTSMNSTLNCLIFFGRTKCLEEKP